jgi:hypothetical protein
MDAEYAFLRLSTWILVVHRNLFLDHVLANMYALILSITGNLFLEEVH